MDPAAVALACYHVMLEDVVGCDEDGDCLSRVWRGYMATASEFATDGVPTQRKWISTSLNSGQ
jgi:hypothetical protein